MSEKPEVKNPKINKVKLTCLVLTLVVIGVLTGFLTYAGGYSKSYPNTYINGTSVSGLTESELYAVCEEYAKKASIPENIRFTLEDETMSIDSSQISLSFDIEKTVALAMGNREKTGFWGRAKGYTKSLFQRTDLSPALKYDKKKLSRVISRFAKPYEEEPVDASYMAENNKLIIRKGHNGIKVSQETLENDLSQYVKNPKGAITLTLTSSRSKTFDADTLYKELSAPAKDAYYARNEAGEVIIIPDKPKVIVDKKALSEALKSDKKTVTVSAKTVPAKVTKNALEKALFSGTMGSWTSYFSASNVPRTQNVNISASRIDGTILLPGESFSYDKAVGPRTLQNGFKIAGVYINNKVEQGIGGGVCQTSSTLYSAVLYANLEIVERVSHSLPVSYMPPGQDATIAEGAIDFVFRNNSDHPIKISATISGGSVTCKIIGTPTQGQKVTVNNTTTAVYEPGIEIETDPSVPKGYKKTVAGEKGCAVSSSRTVYQDGKAIKTEPLTKSVYHATPTVITVNPEDKNTPPENLTEYSENVVAETEETPATPPENAEQTPPPSEEIIEI